MVHIEFDSIDECFCGYYQPLCQFHVFFKLSGPLSFNCELNMTWNYQGLIKVGFEMFLVTG